MIIINDKEYKEVEYEVSNGEFSSVRNGKRVHGVSPFISFKCDNIYLGIETIYPISWIRDLDENTVVDITEYISDITYEDVSIEDHEEELGFISLIDGEHKGSIEKLEDNKINLNINCKANEFDSDYNIVINENVYINFDEEEPK